MKITVPDDKELELDRNPLEVSVDTPVGPVRPVVVASLLNRMMRRRMERAIRSRAHSPEREVEEPSPILVPQKRVSDAEVTALMADMMLAEWDRYHAHFPARTLGDYLDARTAETMERAVRQGKPIDRDAVRRGLGALMEEARRERN